MPVTVKDVRHIARLASLMLEPEEEQEMATQLSKILDYVRQLDEVDIEGVEPMSHVLDIVNAVRPDTPEERISHEEALRSAPSADSDYFRVPRFVE